MSYKKEQLYNSESFLIIYNGCRVVTSYLQNMIDLGYVCTGIFNDMLVAKDYILELKSSSKFDDSLKEDIVKMLYYRYIGETGVLVLQDGTCRILSSEETHEYRLEFVKLFIDLFNIKLSHYKHIEDKNTGIHNAFNKIIMNFKPTKEYVDRLRKSRHQSDIKIEKSIMGIVYFYEGFPYNNKSNYEKNAYKVAFNYLFEESSKNAKGTKADSAELHKFYMEDNFPRFLVHVISNVHVPEHETRTTDQAVGFEPRVYSTSILIIPIFRHPLTPVITVLTKEEIREEIPNMNADDMKRLPKQSLYDPVSRIMMLQPGDIVRATRVDSNTGGHKTSVEYRIIEEVTLSHLGAKLHSASNKTTKKAQNK